MTHTDTDPKFILAEQDEARYWDADRACGIGWEGLADRERYLTTGDFPIAENEDADEDAWAAWLEDTFTSEVSDR